MKTIIVGGTFGENPKKSGVVKKLSKVFDAIVFNGGSVDDLKGITNIIPQFDLVFWMPNIDNIEEDITFTKGLGAVLIVSKVLRENRTRTDAVTRIFKYGGNAVLAITKVEKKFKFELIDALDNTWINTEDIQDLADQATDLYDWTKDSKRVGTLRMNTPMDDFIKLNTLVADESHKQHIRYFGNLSTRCTKMFPSIRTDEDSYFVSARNTDKSRLNSDDMIQVTTDNSKLKYFGYKKPSVDTPVQVELYKLFPKINYFIHGHAFVEDVNETEHYYPCGDMREVPEIVKLIDVNYDIINHGIINLKNHGFLIYADTLEHLESLIQNIKFKVKD